MKSARLPAPWLSTPMPAANSAAPATTTVREPRRSSSRPASGDPIDIASTTGISMKLAFEPAIPSAAVANAGMKTNPASPRPAPAERRFARAAWRVPKRLMRRIGSAARSSIRRKSGARITANSRKGQTFSEVRLAPKRAVSI